MSLVAWFPLNGDTKDYSINNIKPTVSSIAYDIKGKIGSKCLTTGAITIKAADTGNIFNKDAQTISLWYYNKEATAGTTGAHLFSGINTMNGNGNRKYSMFAYPNNNDFHVSICDDGSTNSTAVTAFFIAGVLPNLKWTHVCLVNDNKTLKIYINGNMIDSKVIPDTWIANFNYDYPLILDSASHKINDFRIYDEALSDKEVYELSKAKILHYTFDDCQEPTVNLMNGVIMDGNGGTGLTVGADAIGNYFIKTVDAAWNTGIDIPGIPVVAGKHYTVSLEIKSDVAFDTFWDANTIASNYTGNDLARESSTTSALRYNSPNTWQKVWITNKVKADAVSPTARDTFCPDDAVVKGHKIYFRNVQLEIKSGPTKYTKKERDGVIRDCSGFGNDAPLAANICPQWVSDSKAGAGAYKFNGANNINAINPIGVGNIVNNISICGWIKKSAHNTAGNHLISIGANGFIRIALDKSGIGAWAYLYYYNSTTSTYSNISIEYGAYTDMLIDVWYHITFTFNNGVCKLYINGNQVLSQDHSAITTSLYCGSSNLYIGTYAGSSEYTMGILDDIRIYATTLNDNDIKHIYNNAISIDNRGNLFIKNFKQLPVTNGLETWLKFDGDTKDYSGNNYDGVITGAPIITTGIDGSCYEFDGVDDFVQVPDLTNFNYSKGISCFMWVYATEAKNWARFFDAGVSAQNDNIVFARYNATNILYLEVKNGTSNGPAIQVACLELNKWQHVGFSIDSTGAANLYIDGVVVVSGTVKVPNIVSRPKNYIAKSNWDTDAYFKGKLQDFRLYNRAITKHEVELLYKLKTGGEF